MPDSDPRLPRERRLARRMAQRFFRLPMSDRLLLLEAVIGLALARLSLIFVPFRVLAARLGTVTPPAQDKSVAALMPMVQQEAVRKVGWAVTRAARYIPFRAVCLPQALAAKTMLSRRGVSSVMHFGVAKAPEALKAHAWLDAGLIEVTGYPLDDSFIEVARFI